MNNEEWIEENVKARKDGDVSIECGHGFINHFVPIRDYDPNVNLVLCTACYQRLLGFFLEEIRTVKFDKVR